MSSINDFYASVFDSYYGKPEQYQQETESPQFLSSGGKERPFIKMLFPGGRQIEYLFGDHLNMLGALNHRRNGGRLAKLLEDAHDTNAVTEKTDLTTGQKLLSNRQKKEWEREQAHPPAEPPSWESDPSVPEPGMEDKYVSFGPRKRKSVEGQQSMFDKREPEPMSAPSKPVMTSQGTHVRAAPGVQEGQPAKIVKPLSAYEKKTRAPILGEYPDVKPKSTVGELGADTFVTQGGVKLHLANPQPQGLPPDSTILNVRNVEHNGNLYRLSYVSHFPEGSFVHVEHGVPKESKEGHVTIEMQPLTPEAHAAMQYMDTRHPLVSTAREMIHGKPATAAKTKEKSPLKRKEGERPEAAAFRETAAETAPLARQARAKAREKIQSAFIAAGDEYRNVTQEVKQFESEHPDKEIPDEIKRHLEDVMNRFNEVKKRYATTVQGQPQKGTPAVIPGGTKPRSETPPPRVTKSPLPVTRGPLPTPPEQLNPKTRTYAPYTISAAASKFADAVVSKYIQDCAADSFLEQFCAAYYGDVEKYGGTQAGHHIDFHGFDSGVPQLKMLEPFKMQAEVGDGPPRHMAGTGEKAGTFKSNPLAKAIGSSTSPTNKYAVAQPLPKQPESLPGQTRMFADEPEPTSTPQTTTEPVKKKTRPSIGEPQHGITFGLPSATKGVNLQEHGGHAKVLASFGLTPAAEHKASGSSIPLVPSKPDAYYKKLSDMELIGLHRDKRDEAATSELRRRAGKYISYHVKRNPSRREEIQQLVNAIETEKGDITPGTFQRAIESYDPTKGAEFATHHNRILSNYIKSRLSRQSKREEKIPGARGIGTSETEPEQQRAHDIADTSAPRSLDELLGETTPPVRSKEATPEEILLHGPEGEGRHAKQATIQRESEVVRDRIVKMSPANQWLMRAHLAGLDAKNISSVLRAKPGSEQLSFMATHDNPDMRAIADDAFRSNVISAAGRNPESIQFRLDTLIGSLAADPTISAVRQRRADPRDSAERFADDVMHALTTQEPETRRITPFEPRMRLPATREGKLKRKSHAEMPGQKKMFTANSKYSGASEQGSFAMASDTTPRPLGYKEVLQQLPENKTDINPSTRKERKIQPMPPAQPPRTGEERWALHTGETADPSELRRIHNIATKYGLIFKVRVSPALDKQHPTSIRWFTFTPAKLKQRFQQRGTPERYRADKTNYAWFGLGKKTPAPPAPPKPKPTDFASHGDLPEAPKVESSGRTLPELPEGRDRPSASSLPSIASGLGMAAAGLIGRRGGAQLARSLSGKQQRRPTGRSTTSQPSPAQPRKSTPAELKRHRAFMETMDKLAKMDAWVAGGFKGPSPELEQTAPEREKKVKKTSTATMTPEAQKMEQDTAAKRRERRNLEETQKLQRARDIASGKITPTQRRTPRQPQPASVSQVRADLNLNKTPVGQPIPTIKGAATKIHGEGIKPVDAHYAVVDLFDLKPSHIGDKDERISPNPDYKIKSDQPRDYSPGSENHKKVLRHIQEKVHQYWTTDNPDALAGPSTSDEEGQVSGGNGRAIAATIAASKGDYEWLKSAIIEKAPQFGFSPEQISKMQKMEHPYLIRVHPGIKSGTEEFGTFAAATNKETRQTEMPIREAASLGKTTLTPEDFNALAEQVSGDKTIGQILSSKNHPIVEKLRNRLKNAAGYHKFFGAGENAPLHESGRDLAEDMILSRFIQPEILEKGTETRSLKNALGTALPHIIRIGDPIIKPLEKAFDYIATHPQVKSLEHLRDDIRRQGNLFAKNDEVSAVTQQLLEEMYASKNKTGSFSGPAIRTLFHEIAKAATDRRRDTGQGSLFEAPETSWIDDVIGAVHKARRRTEEEEKAKVEQQKRKLTTKAPSLFSSHHHDAALELYSQVHMAYFGAIPHQRVARKNSSRKTALQS